MTLGREVSGSLSLGRTGASRPEKTSASAPPERRRDFRRPEPTNSAKRLEFCWIRGSYRGGRHCRASPEGGLTRRPDAHPVAPRHRRNPDSRPSWCKPRTTRATRSAPVPCPSAPVALIISPVTPRGSEAWFPVRNATRGHERHSAAGAWSADVPAIRTAWRLAMGATAQRTWMSGSGGSAIPSPMWKPVWGGWL
jgi:hypothetical protein